MKTVEVSQSALESLQKMVEQLQGERDELLECATFALRRFGPEAHELKFSQRHALYKLKAVIEKCTAKPEMWA